MRGLRGEPAGGNGRREAADKAQAQVCLGASRISAQ